MRTAVWLALALGLLAGTAWPQSLPQLAAQAAANPKDASLQYRLGQAYADSGDLRAATDAYFRAHLAAPTDAKIIGALARTYAVIPNYEKASYWYRKLLTLRPADARITAEAAELALRYGQPLQAELLLQPGVAAHPDDLKLWQLLAATYEVIKLESEALRCYDRMVQLGHNDPVLQQRLMHLYLRTGRPDKALPLVQTALTARPTDTTLLLLLGEVQSALRNPKAAVAAFAEATRLAPGNTAYRLKLAEALAQTGATGAALDEYDAAIRMSQPTVELLQMVVSLAADRGETERAAHYLALLVALAPTISEHRRRLASNAQQQGDQAKALAHYRELQRLGDVQAPLDEAMVAQALGARDWALGRLQTMRPELTAHPSLGVQVAAMLVALGETLAGTEIALEALRANSLSLDDRIQAGRVLAEAGDLEHAESVLRQALQSDARHPGALLGLARVLQLRDSWTTSYDLLRAGYMTHPAHEEMALSLQAAAAHLGRLDHLAQFLQQQVTVDPQNEVALAALTSTWRALGGPSRAASELRKLALSQPQITLWTLSTARELAGAGRLREATATYEALLHDAQHGSAARVGYCETMLAEARYGELLAALARLADPAAQGPEGYALLTSARPAAQLTGVGQSTATEAAARAAVTLFLSTPGTEEYYLGVADMCLATRTTASGLAWLTRKEVSPHQPIPLAAGLLRLQRHEGRATEAIDWLEKLAPQPRSVTLQLEELQCLLAVNRTTEAALKAETLLAVAPEELRPQVHFLCGEALTNTYRLEEAAWHYAQARSGGYAPEESVSRLRDLCRRALFPEETVLNLIHELWAQGCDEAALAVADSVAAQPRYEAVRQWALTRANVFPDGQ